MVRSQVMISFGEIVAEARVAWPRLVIRCKCYSTEAFTLDAYISFSSGDPKADEILVVEWMIRCDGRSYKCNCSLLRDNWDVIAEMPPRVLGLGHDAPAVADWALSCVDAAVAWLGAQSSIMASVLSEAAV
jgi:hypothetical protein